MKTRSVALTSCAMLTIFILAAVSNAYFNEPASGAIFSWCAASVFLAALLRSHSGSWLPLTIAAAAGDLGTQLLTGTGVLAASGIVIADILEICLAAAAIRAIILNRCWYLSLRIILMLAIVSLVSSVVSTAFEMLWINNFVEIPLQPIVRARSFTEALDLLIALPFVLSWTEYTLIRNLSAKEILEIFLLSVASASSSYLLLESGTPFLFLAIPLLLLATLNGGLLGSTASVFSLSLVVRWFTFDGPTQLILQYGKDNTNLLIIYHLFVLTALLSSVPLGVLLARLENSAEELRLAGIAADQARQDAEAARDRAETADRAKGDFLSVMSHELRTPMTGVLGLVDLLAQETPTHAQMRHLEDIRKSGRHLLSIINDVLDFSKIESGKLELETTAFSMRVVFEDVCATIRPLCEAKGIDFRGEFDSNIPDLVQGDPTRIRQVLLNLAGNALKFTHSGFVNLSVSKKLSITDNICLRFTVKDTGIGIGQDRAPEIFKAFTQEDKSTARRFGGSGLGLAISQRLVNAMGGIIEFDSSPGVGSSFWFEVRLDRCDRQEPAAPLHFGALQARPCRILVAEDIALNRSIIRSMLALDDHILVFAQNGLEAVEWASHGCFDLILMDVQMPVMDGVEATRRIRILPRPLGDVPIIALTANVLGRDRDRYLEAGMNVCVSKPIDWNDLKAAINKFASLQSPTVPLTTNQDIAVGSKSPLIDLNKLQALKNVLGPEIEPLLVQAIGTAQTAFEDLEGNAVTSPAVAQKMHALKGMAGMLGLVGIQRLAAELEVGFGIDASPKHHEAELHEVVTATRAALVKRDFLTDENPAGQ